MPIVYKNNKKVAAIKKVETINTDLIDATATVETNIVGTPSVSVTSSKTEDGRKTFNFAFKNLKGEKGDTGEPGCSFEIKGTSLIITFN